MTGEQQQLEAGIAALEARRGELGDAVVDASVAGLRARLAALGGAAAADQALRQVGILFLDVVGSTTLAQRLDPEEIHAVMDGALARLSAIVEAHQGRVLQYAGDNLLAAFGADGAREDDAERAVRCGLALLAEGRRLGAEVLRAHGHAGFDVRVGVHSGGVLLGGGVDAEGSIRGIAVNIAARMEQTAPAGALRISDATWALVRGAFDAEPQPPLAVKGVDEPVRSHLVLRARPAALRDSGRGIEGVATRMIGRDAELQALQDAFARVRTARRPGVALVVADAGLGKTRLLLEFERRVAGQAQVLAGRASPQTRSQAYGLLRDLLAGWLRLGDDDSLALARSKLEQGLAPLLGGDEGDAADGVGADADIPLLGHLIGIDFGDDPRLRGLVDDAPQIRRRGFRAATRVLRRLAARDGRPLVLMLDDLHWADDGSLDFLADLVRDAPDLPLLLLGLTRPALFERRAGWPGAAHALRLTLAPLAPDGSGALADELLRKFGKVPPPLRALVTGGADGNPFYMEELIRMLIGEGAIAVDGERWTLAAERLQALRVPQTLTGVLQARLDSLAPAEKRALQQAAVIGFVFWDQALASIDPGAADTLPGVARRELVLPRPDAGLAGVREYVFHHQLLHQVTYDTVLKRLRRAWHARAGAWLAGLSGARANDFLGVAADHFEKAGDARRAAEYHARAAEHAAGRYAHEAVFGHVARALALLDGAAAAGARPAEDLALAWRLRALRERALDLQGRRAEQQNELDALDAIAEALDDDRRRADAAKRRSYLAMRKADTAGQIDAARRAIGLAQRAGDTELRLRAQNLLATGLCDLNDTAAGEAMATAGLAEAQAHGLRRVEVSFLNTLALIASQRDDFVGHLELSRLQWQVLRDLGDRPAEAVAALHLGIALLGLGERVQSRRHLEEGLRLARAAGDRVMEPHAHAYLSLIAQREGDLATARAQAQQALDTSVAASNGETRIVALFRAGEVALATGQLAAAGAAFDSAHQAAAASHDPMRFDAAAGLASVALAAGDVGAAARALRGVLDHLAAGGSLDGTESRQRVRLVCHRLLADTGDARRAADMLATAHAELRERADRIEDAALRHAFLNDIPEHRELMQAWAASTGERR